MNSIAIIIALLLCYSHANPVQEAFVAKVLDVNGTHTNLPTAVISGPSHLLADKAMANATAPAMNSTTVKVPPENQNITSSTEVPPTTLPPTNSTTAATTSTTAVTTIKPNSTTAQPTSTTITIPTSTTTPLPATTTQKPKPSPQPTEPNKPTAAPTASPHNDRKFDGPSFIGGIILACGLTAIGFVAFKFYKARTEHNYHTL